MSTKTFVDEHAASRQQFSTHSPEWIANERTLRVCDLDQQASVRDFCVILVRVGTLYSL